MLYVMCDAWYVMFRTCFFCKILTLWVKGRPQIPNLSNFRPFKWYSKIDPRWQSFVHNILQGLQNGLVSSGAYLISKECKNNIRNYMISCNVKLSFNKKSSKSCSSMCITGLLFNLHHCSAKPCIAQWLLLGHTLCILYCADYTVCRV